MSKQQVKFTKFENDTKEALALDKLSFDSATNKLTAYSSSNNNIKEEVTLPIVDVDNTLTQQDAAADAKVVGDSIGTLNSLTTTTKTNVVSAINEVDSHADTNTNNIGTLNNLTTTAKSNVVAAVNEVDAHADTNASAITQLNTELNALNNQTVDRLEGIISDAQTENLIIADALIYKEYYDANGNVAKTTSTSWWRLPIIPASPSTSYSAGSCRTLFFDSNGDYISENASWNGTTFTTPENTAYIGITSNMAYTSAYLYLTSNTPSSWVKGERLITTSKIKNFDADVIDAADKTYVPYSTGNQLFDKDGVYTELHTGEYVNYDSGIISTVATIEWFSLKVVESENYVLSGLNNSHVAFFTHLPVGPANYISGLLAPDGTSFTVPENATIMTISVRLAEANQLMVQKGTTASSYEAYEHGIKTSDYLTKSITLAKLADDVTNKFNSKTVVTVGSSNCDYTNICTAIKNNQSNTIFKLAAETFDVQSAYEEEYGSDFFTNYTKYSEHPDDPMYRGLNLGIGCEIYGQPNTKLNFLYSGDNADVAKAFSLLSMTDNNIVNGIAFNLGGHCRYAIHDDYSTIAGSTNIIEHCVFFGDTSEYGRPYIGTGLGTASAMIYRYCIFASNSTRAIGLHNNVANALGRVEIYGCYAAEKIYVMHYGTSTTKTPVMIHDCKASGIYLTWAAQETYPNENMELYSWNNTIT